jgi:hypothetical protein
MGVSTWAGVYTTDEPAGDQRGRAPRPDPPAPLRLPELLALLPDEGSGEG